MHSLTPHECDALLRSAERGRMAVSTPQGPHIVPVGYAVVDDDRGLAVVAPVGAYSLLGTYAAGAMLAFEVDGLEPATGTPWSVVARGRGEVLRRPPTLLPSRWPTGARQLFVVLRPEELSGHGLAPVTLAP